MKQYYFKPLLIASSLLLSSCGSTSKESVKLPPLNSSFDWRIDTAIDPNSMTDAKVIDVDAFATTKESIDAWHKRGVYVIAYISVGTQDIRRDDAKDFPDSLLGNSYPDYDDERFLDIRQIDKIAPIIKNRFDMIKDKGFDGIEPDNIDLYVWDSEQKNITGFSISTDDSKKYMNFIIQEAHNRGLSIGQKNANELSFEFVDKFDWALTESAFYANIAEDLKVYPEHNKAVFSVEYTDNMNIDTFLSEVCTSADALGYTAILKNRELDAFIRTCP
jgi:hypothetical protein